MHLISPGLWAESCWNIQEPSSQWNTENKGIEILFVVVQLVLFSHCSVEKLYVKHTWSWPSQKTQGSTASTQMRISVSGSVGPDTLLMVRASLGYTVLAPSFPSIALLGILLSSEPLFSISSRRCLLTSHCKWIEILFRNKSIFRKQCNLPGQLTAIQPWLSPLQATSTCRRHRLSLHKVLLHTSQIQHAQCARYTVCVRARAHHGVPTNCDTYTHSWERLFCTTHP